MKLDIRGKWIAVSGLIAAALALFVFVSGDHARRAGELPAGLASSPILAAVAAENPPFTILPDKIPWVKQPDGTETAVVAGDMKKPGLYVQMRRWPPHAGGVPKAHYHPEDRYGYVVSGTIYQGIGEKFDPAKLEARHAGTFFSEPKHVGHFALTKDEGAVLYYVGIGPTGVTVLEK